MDRLEIEISGELPESGKFKIAGYVEEGVKTLIEELNKEHNLKLKDKTRIVKPSKKSAPIVAASTLAPESVVADDVAAESGGGINHALERQRPIGGRERNGAALVSALEDQSQTRLQPARHGFPGSPGIRSRMGGESLCRRMEPRLRVPGPVGRRRCLDGGGALSTGRHRPRRDRRVPRRFQATHGT